METLTPTQLNFRIKLCIWIIIIGLALSGVTAFPLETELAWLVNNSNQAGAMHHWLQTVYNAIKNTNQTYPFLSYGTDWLAFAHLMLALLFVGPLKDPVKNIWVIEFGMMACVLILPLAFIAGPVRGIPVFWRWIDSSFGIIAIIPLWICRRYIKQLASRQTSSAISSIAA
jgi:hypothetical protein